MKTISGYKIDKNLEKTIVCDRETFPKQIRSILACDTVKYGLRKRKKTSEPIPEDTVRFYTFFTVNVSR